MAITLLFALTGWIVLRNAIETTASTMEDEVGASFQAYQSLWKARAELLASVSLTLSQMSDVRSAFGTRDPATIRDTANELWKKLAIKNAVFLVTDARGKVDRSGGRYAASPDRIVRTAARPLSRTRYPAFWCAEGTCTRPSSRRSTWRNVPPKRAGGRIRRGLACGPATEGRHRRQRIPVRLRRPPIASSLNPARPGWWPPAWRRIPA